MTQLRAGDRVQGSNGDVLVVTGVDEDRVWYTDPRGNPRNSSLEYAKENEMQFEEGDVVRFRYDEFHVVRLRHDGDVVVDFPGGTALSLSSSYFELVRKPLPKGGSVWEDPEGARVLVSDAGVYQGEAVVYMTQADGHPVALNLEEFREQYTFLV